MNEANSHYSSRRDSWRLCMQMNAIILVNLKSEYQKPAVHNQLIFPDQADHSHTVNYCSTAQPQQCELLWSGFYVSF